MAIGFDYTARTRALKDSVAQRGLDAFIVSAQDSIYYLTGASYKPLERPFFIILYPDAEPVLLVPQLEQEHMRKARNLELVASYWDYPAPPARAGRKNSRSSSRAAP